MGGGGAAALSSAVGMKISCSDSRKVGSLDDDEGKGVEKNGGGASRSSNGGGAPEDK
jgi:hypothetical protein